MNQPRTIDLNSDVGESFGRWTLGDDTALLRSLTSANVACGFHAGDFSTMDATVALCLEANVAVGAHPGYPDLQGFGRRAIAISPREIEQIVLYQIGALEAFCRANGVRLTHVKAHGSLYNTAAVDIAAARGLARGVARYDASLPLVGMAGSRAYEIAAREAGLRLVTEAYADRRYMPDGTLQPRSFAGSLITDPAEAAAQALSIAHDGTVTTVDGRTIPVAAETICVHGDTPGASAIAAAIRTALTGQGISVQPFGVTAAA